jgi:hypothetical protein
MLRAEIDARQRTPRRSLTPITALDCDHAIEGVETDRGAGAGLSWATLQRRRRSRRFRDRSFETPVWVYWLTLQDNRTQLEDVGVTRLVGTDEASEPCIAEMQR